VVVHGKRPEPRPIPIPRPTIGQPLDVLAPPSASSSDSAEPEPTWRDAPAVQVGGGIVAGAAIGTVPGGPIGAQLAIDAGKLPKGTRPAQLGKAIGEITSGIVQMVIGGLGSFGGGALSTTGGGAVVGVPVAIASAGLMVNGYGTLSAGLGELGQAWSEGGSSKASEGRSIHHAGEKLETIDDVLANPRLVDRLTPDDLMARLNGKAPDGWRIEKLAHGRHAGQGFMLRQYSPSGEPTGRMVQWHPGGGHHGPQPYWKINNGNGPVRIGPQF
jgi:hypothetical protein